MTPGLPAPSRSHLVLLTGVGRWWRSWAREGQPAGLESHTPIRDSRQAPAALLSGLLNWNKLPAPKQADGDAGSDTTVKGLAGLHHWAQGSQELLCPLPGEQ